MPPQTPFRIPEDPIIDKATGQLTWPWRVHLELTATQVKQPANQAPPATSIVPGSNGQMAVGGGFLYVYDGSAGQQKWIKFAPVPF